MEPPIYGLTIKDFKNLLVNNKFIAYQNELENSLSYPFYGKAYHQLTTDEIEYCKLYKINWCQDYNCYNTELQYHKIMDNRMYQIECEKRKIISDCFYCYNNTCTTQKINYDVFSNKSYKSMDKIKIYESLWVNCKTTLKLHNKINITGNYEIIPNQLSPKLGELSYLPNEPYGLKLNDIPVSYISGCTGGNMILRQIYSHCLNIHFTFDLTTYCHVIDLILKCRKYKHNWFGTLPFELIKYILYLTSIA